MKRSEIPLCDPCADHFERSKTITWGDGNQMILQREGEMFRAVALPTTPLQG
jgi:hypothetical protein